MKQLANLHTTLEDICAIEMQTDNTHFGVHNTERPGK